MENSYKPVSPSMAGGTAFWDTVIEAPYDVLVEKLGKPPITYLADEKIQYEWAFKDDQGRVVTVYDWKEYGNRRPSEWHVGGHDRQATEAFKAWFLKQ